MIIDIHAHTSNHPMWNLHTESATIEELERLAAKHGIGKIVLMATYFPLKRSGLANRELLKRIEGKPLFQMFGSLDAANNLEQGIAELNELARLGQIAGIKLYPGYQNFDPSSPAVFPIYELAGQLNLPVMFHGGELHGCCPREQRDTGQLRCGFDYCRLLDLEHLARPRQMAGAFWQFPKVKFVVSHLANDYFEELRSVMSEFSNVFTDISGQFVSGSHEDTPHYRKLIVAEIQRFLALKNGHRRVMFGTDFPIQSYADSLDLVYSLGLNRETEDAILFRNAEFLLDRSTEDNQ
ncbi:MAG: Amidohydrolase [bacterium ADurb.Bin400]|nr:MAG: Amidohydrolase [bacterium ADurb.Bin400]